MTSSADLQLRDIEDRFRSEWACSAAPEISLFVPTEPSGLSRAVVFARLVALDLQLRWRLKPIDAETLPPGTPNFPAKPTLEDYLVRYPELGTKESLPLELICAEYRIRRDGGDCPEHNEYLSRFPAQAEELRDALVEVDQTDSMQATIDTPPLAPESTGLHRATATANVQAREEDSNPESRGRHFGEYELLDEIARGGMGVVYKARQVKLNRIVALKMILTGELAGDEEIQRFKIEAEAAAKLDHAGIVPIYEIGEHQGQHYFSMGYVDGPSLSQRLKEGPLPPQEAAELTKKIAEAVAYAHTRGVIHRDLKPANVLLDSSGEPRVTDFGLAKQLESDRELTRTGAIMGTPNYMPPEQAGGRTAEVGPRSDVYALGAILYCLLTGRPPFQSANPMDVLVQVLQREPVAPETLNPATPKDLQTVCLKCLQKDADQRFSSASEVADELGRFLRGEPVVTRPISSVERAWRWCKRKPAQAAALVLAMLFVATLAIGGPYVALVQTDALRVRKQADDDRVRSVADQIATADLTYMPSYLSQLDDNEEIAKDRLHQIIVENEQDQGILFRVNLALFALGEPVWPAVLPGLQRASPAQIRTVRELLAENSTSVPVDVLWEDLKTLLRTESRAEALAIAALLASLDSESDEWSPVATPLAYTLIQSNPLFVEQWADALTPIKSTLSPQLESIFNRDPDEVSELERLRTAEILAKYVQEDPQTLTRLLCHAEPDAFEMLLQSALPQRETIVAAMINVMDQPLRPNADESRKETIAKRQARAAIAVLHLGEIDEVLPYLRRANDPRGRSYLIHWMADYSVSPQWIGSCLGDDRLEHSVIQSLLLTLGQYRLEDFATEDHPALLTTITNLYRHDDSGVHAAAEWLLNHWGQRDRLEKSRASFQKRLEKASPGGWFEGPLGDDFAIVPPGTYWMGSDLTHDPYSRGMPEPQKQVSIDRTLAVATKPVTLAQYRKFFEALLSGNHDEFPRPNPPELTYPTRVVLTDDSPMTGIPWIAAAMYCNWLSKVSEIAEEQWCYDVQVGDEGLRVSAKEGCLDFIGFRLPMQEEWEYVCRAGTTTRRYFGHSDQLLPAYAWFAENSDNRTHPVGLKKPNDWGLFDMHGNVWEMCHDGVSRGGGCYDGGKWWVRSAQAQGIYLHDGTGFRVVRTVP